MEDFARTLLGIFAAVAPLGALPVFAALYEDEPAPTPAPAVASAAAAFALLAGAALIADPFLDLLHVSAENFRFAAAVVMAPLALRLLVTGKSMALPQGVLGVAIAWVFPLAVPLIAGPAAVVASMSYAARFGAGDTIIASAAVTALTAALYLAAPHIASVLRRAGLDALARLSGGLLAIIAVELAISGVRSV